MTQGVVRFQRFAAQLSREWSMELRLVFRCAIMLYFALRVMAADGVDDTLVFHAALGAVLIVRHRDHNADRRG